MSFPAVDNLPPIHPGEILRDELAALHLSARRFTEHIGVPSNAVSEILNGKRRVTRKWRCGWRGLSPPARITG
jgi:antitoxin HigA-1